MKFIWFRYKIMKCVKVNTSKWPQKFKRCRCDGANEVVSTKNFLTLYFFFKIVDFDFVFGGPSKIIVMNRDVSRHSRFIIDSTK